VTEPQGSEPIEQIEAFSLEALSFEEAYRMLEEMAQALEDGGLTLAEVTNRYEEGMSLVRRCNHLLDQAELKITKLRDLHSSDALEQELDEIGP
jgi:exodeoxyribonuclease VII small subunit